MDDKTTIRFTGAFKIVHLKAGEHTFLIPFDDEIAKLIGQIIAYWGAFEVRMNALIETLSAGMAIEVPPNWRQLSFRKRKALFKDIMRRYTAAMFPALTPIFDQIADQSAALHWRRNVIAHGYYEMLPSATPNDDGSRRARFIATGTVKGKRQSIELEPEKLERLWHDIAHLTGRLMATINLMGGWVDNQTELIIPDTDLLSDPQSGSFRILAKPNKS